MSPGFFVAFEGGEGSGKSSQVLRLAAVLRARGHSVLTTYEPGATSVGKHVRQLVLETDEKIAPRAEALLFAADRAHHVATVIRPALAGGQVVLTDRYLDSSIAYQGAGRTLSTAEIAQVSEWATEGLLPDLTILLDIAPEHGLSRAKGPSGPDRLERETLAFHQLVRAEFLRLAAAAPQRYLVLDAAQPIDDLAATIARTVLERIAA
jgi:dTMP kinase